MAPIRPCCITFDGIMYLCTHHEKQDEQLHQFWELESLGVVDKESSLYEQLKGNVSFDGVKYEISLPWKDSMLDIPDNFCRV